MTNGLLQQTIEECTNRIRNTNFYDLHLDDYNLRYVESQLPHLSYYLWLYGSCVSKLMSNNQRAEYVIDFGGGSGFLSYFLKQLGFRVIYCDNNPLAVKAARTITTHLGVAPDIFVDGSADELFSICRSRRIQPDFLLSVDVIEHVYDPNQLFQRLYELNPAMQMIFTTVCNPMNLYRRFFLHRMMKGVEQNYFLPMRSEFIGELAPDFTAGDVQNLAYLTRGYTYASIRKAIDDYKAGGALPKPCEGKNTCDPNSGNWIERLLPLRCYRTMANESGCRDISFVPGYYYRESPAFRSGLLGCLNRLIKYGRYAAMPIAPFIYICINKKRGL